MMEVDVSILIAVLGFVMSIASFYYSRKNDATKLENRITQLETKIDPLWNAIVSEIPKLLIAPHTPILDGYLHKGVELGWECLNDGEFSHLEELVEQEMVALRLYLKAGIGSPKELDQAKGRRVGLALIRAGARVDRSLKNDQEAVY